MSTTTAAELDRKKTIQFNKAMKKKFAELTGHEVTRVYKYNPNPQWVEIHYVANSLRDNAQYASGGRLIYLYNYEAEFKAEAERLLKELDINLKVKYVNTHVGSACHYALADHHGMVVNITTV